MTRLTSRLWFLFLCAVSLAMAWRPLSTAFALALGDDEYTHILLIIPVAIALISLEWRPLKSFSAPSPQAGSVLLLVSLLLAVCLKWGVASLHPDVQLSGSMLALVMWWIGAFVLCFGTRVSRALLFPLGFSFLIVPLPRVVVNWIVSQLQQWSAFASYLFFSGAGVPVAREGVILSIPGLTIEVAEECSSIRSSLMLLVTTMVLAHIFLRSPWRKALAVAIVVPLAVAKNGLRIFTIAMLGTRVDPGFLTGRLHHDGGVLFFIIALAAIFLVLWLLRRGEPRVPQKAVLHPAAS